MHQHIIVNHDIGLHLVIYSDEAEVDLVSILDKVIIEQLCHA